MRHRRRTPRVHYQSVFFYHCLAQRSHSYDYSQVDEFKVWHGMLSCVSRYNDEC